MDNNKLVCDSNKELGFKLIKIDDIEIVDDYLFIVLSNGQNILTNGKELYDVSEYDHLSSFFLMGDKYCAVFIKDISICVVNLKTMEVLFQDNKAYHVSKQDDRTLNVIMKIGGGNNAIYDIETKKYLSAPDNYEFEHSLGNNLYVFREESNKSETNFYDRNRCVMNANGKILMEDIDGWIYLSDNHIIIIKKDEMRIVGLNDESILDVKTIKQNEEIIAKPDYYDGNIIIMVKGAIKIYTPSLLLIKEIKIEELNEVIDYEIVSSTLKLCLPHMSEDAQTNKHLFVNLETGKTISHIRIEGYPYWKPTAYVGQDSINTKLTNYHFYNKDFDSIISVNAKSCENVDNDCESIFFIKTVENDIEKKMILNTENASIKEVSYDYIMFLVNHHDGYGVDLTEEKMDFFDENLEVIIQNFDYKKYALNLNDFGYFIVNNYICVISHFVDGFGMSRCRTIIQNKNGDIILDSVNHRCFAVGDFIQIVYKEDLKKSEFLNTLTGEIGQLSISVKVNEHGKIDLNEISNINNILTVSNNSQLCLPLEENDNELQTIKKLLFQTEDL